MQITKKKKKGPACRSKPVQFEFFSSFPTAFKSQHCWGRPYSSYSLARNFWLDFSTTMPLACYLRRLRLFASRFSWLQVNFRSHHYIKTKTLGCKTAVNSPFFLPARNCAGYWHGNVDGLVALPAAADGRDVVIFDRTVVIGFGRIFHIEASFRSMCSSTCSDELILSMDCANA